MAPPDRISQQITTALDAQLAAGCPGGILEVITPDRRISLVRGRRAREQAEPLATNHLFRAASVTKAVTAATAVRLAARGIWSLDDPVPRYLPAGVITALRSLRGLSNANELTLRRLLSHTGGLPDYFFNPSFQSRVRAEPERLWQPAELVEAATAGAAQLFEPGADFAYGDTGYVVIGLAIESVLGCSLASAYRTHVFDVLRMNSTFLEWREPPPEGRVLSHHYDGDADLYDRNLSFDWAGGGLVTTASDLARFIDGLFRAELFERQWLQQMCTGRAETSWRPGSSARYLRYGLGIGTQVAYGQELIGATGVWGAFAFYWPVARVTVAGTLNRVGADRPALLDAVVKALSTT